MKSSSYQLLERFSYAGNETNQASDQPTRASLAYLTVSSIRRTKINLLKSRNEKKKSLVQSN